MTRIVAHRGLHSEPAGGPRENTLAAIDAAVAAGIDTIEIDVRLSSDGEVVLVHDATLERLWGDPRRVDEVAWTDLRELGGRHRIPSLDEALTRVADTGSTLLIDMDHAAPAGPAAAVVAAHRGSVRTAWCGLLAGMEQVRAALPTADIWLPWAQPTAPGTEDLAELGPTTLNAPHLVVGSALVAQAHAAGLQVAVWTVDDPVQAAWLAGIGVDSITSNDPAAIAAAIATAPTAPPWHRERLVAGALAGLAAEETALARRQGPGPVRTKAGPADHVTDVDTSVERAVRAVIGAQFEADAVVGEEYGGEPGAGRTWYVDPIDGTANLANGVPWTSFSLAMFDAGRPVVAAALDPVGPTPVVAAAGQGAHRSGQRLHLTPREPTSSDPAHDPLAGQIVTTELAGAEPWPGFDAFLAGLARRHCTLRIPGSGTATLLGVALGRGVAALVHRYSPIDHASAVLVVAEAGGIVLDGDGNPTLHPDRGPVVVGRDLPSAQAVVDLWQATRPA